jgi:hypothetical protein
VKQRGGETNYIVHSVLLLAVHEEFCKYSAFLEQKFMSSRLTVYSSVYTNQVDKIYDPQPTSTTLPSETKKTQVTAS